MKKGTLFRCLFCCLFEDCYTVSVLSPSTQKAHLHNPKGNASANGAPNPARGASSPFADALKFFISIFFQFVYQVKAIVARCFFICQHFFKNNLKIFF